YLVESESSFMTPKARALRPGPSLSINRLLGDESGLIAQLQPLIEPPQDDLETLHSLAWPAIAGQAVRGQRKQREAGRLVQHLECAVVLESLIHGRAIVLDALNHQHRRPHVVDERDRRARQVIFRLAPRKIAEPVRHEINP